MSTTTFTYKQDELVCLGDRYPGKTLTIKTDCSDLDAHELLDIFKSFMLGCGYAEKSFYDACDQATQENPYAKGRNRSRVEQTDELRHSSGIKVHPEKTDEIRHSWGTIPTPEENSYQDPYKYPTGM
jgi:hypothetical protein